MAFSETNALELSGVCKAYGDFRLEQVSFTLPSGSIMGFIGENGAGKTTTLKATELHAQQPAGAQPGGEDEADSRAGAH